MDDLPEISTRTQRAIPREPGGHSNGSTHFRRVAAPHRSHYHDSDAAPAFESPPEPTPPAVDIWMAIELFLRRWYWFFLAGPLLAVGGYFAGQTLFEPAYTATATLLRVDTENATEYYHPKQLSADTFGALMQSPELLQRIAKQAQPRLSPDQLKALVRVEPESESDIVTISADGDSPQIAAALANLYAEQAVRYSQELQAKEAGEINNVLKQSVSQMDNDLAKLNQQLRSVPRLELQKPSGAKSTLETKLQTAKDELDLLLLHKTDNHPDVIAKKKQIQLLEDQLRRSVEKPADPDGKTKPDTPDGDLLRSQLATIAGNQNIYDWNEDIAKPTVTYGAATETDLEQWGLYGQLRVKPLDPLTLIGGGRFSWFETTSGSTSSSEKGKFTPYAGVVYDLTEAVSAYGSYTEVFQPQTATDVSGNLLDPRSGQQFEIGLKAELFDGVNASLALFDLTDENRAISDPDNLGSYLGLGEAHLRGVEAELSGEVMENWEVALGYTYTDTEYKNTTRAAGSEFYTPEHMLQLWTKYTFDGRGDWTDGLFVGGGVKVFSSFRNVSRAVNATTGVATATTIEAPAYAVVDLQAGYKFSDNVTATLTVNNLFDEKYYERVGGTSVFNFYGEPRSVSFKLATTF